MTLPLCVWFATLCIFSRWRSLKKEENLFLCVGAYSCSHLSYQDLPLKPPKYFGRTKCMFSSGIAIAWKMFVGNWEWACLSEEASLCPLSDPWPLYASMRHPQILSKWASGSLALSLLCLCLSLSPLLNERQNSACPSIPYPQSHVPLSSISSLGSFGKSEFRLDNFSSLWGAIFTCNFC